MSNKSFWKNIWDSKGNSDSKDLLFLDGYEHLEIEFDSQQIAKNIIKMMNIKKDDKILEVGCGVGFLSREFNNYDYYGVDYSAPIIKKHKSFYQKHNVVVSEANRLPFKNKTFDKIFCFGVVQYFPDKEYTDETVSEMLRLAKDLIFLGDLKSEATKKEHFVYSRETLVKRGFKIIPGFHEQRDYYRYNAVLNID